MIWCQRYNMSRYRQLCIKKMKQVSHFYIFHVHCRKHWPRKNIFYFCSVFKINFTNSKLRHRLLRNMWNWTVFCESYIREKIKREETRFILISFNVKDNRNVKFAKYSRAYQTIYSTTNLSSDMGKTNVKAKIYISILGIPQRDGAQLSLV